MLVTQESWRARWAILVSPWEPVSLPSFVRYCWHYTVQFLFYRWRKTNRAGTGRNSNEGIAGSGGWDVGDLYFRGKAALLG